MSQNEKTLGQVVAEARKAKGLSQKELAALTGYGESGVSIARIESGVIRRPSEAKLVSLATALGLEFPHLRELASQPVARHRLSGPALRKANLERREQLTRRTAEFEREVKARYEPLEALRRNIETEFLEPLFEIGQSVSGLPVSVRDEVAVRASRESTAADDETRRMADDYVSGVADSLAAQFAAGAAAGGALGAGAAFATYSAVGAFATASTGTAISTLSGAAAANATMAALGGGSLAAGGFGVAGGTILLGAIAAAPVLLLGGVGIWIGAGKLSDREDDQEKRIKQAEDEFDTSARRIRSSFGWVSRAETFLTLALHRSTSRLDRLRANGTFGDAPPPATSWEDLSEDERAILSELFELASVTISVLPLPVIPTPEPGQSADEVAKLESASREWNDAVLNKALSLFAL